MGDISTSRVGKERFPQCDCVLQQNKECMHTSVKCDPQTFSVAVSLSSGVFEIAEASGVQQGTKIVLHLKDDCKEFSAEDRVKGIAAGAAAVAEL